MNAIPAGYVEVSKGVYERQDITRQRQLKSFNVVSRMVEQLYQDYLKTKSVHRAAEIHGISGETARRMMVSQGYKLLRSKWSKDEEETLFKLRGEKTAKDIAKILGRSKASVDLRVSRINRGLDVQHTPNSKKTCKACQKEFIAFDSTTKYCSIQCSSHSEEIRRGLIDYWKGNDHLGRPRILHFEEKKCIICEKKFTPNSKCPTKKYCSISCAQRSPEVNKKKITTLRANPFAIKTGYTSCKRGWAEVGGQRVFFRSSWEENYAHYLEWLKQQGEIQEWQHEPDTFWFDKVKRGTRSYLPDFKVINKSGETEYHEVKGWMDAKSKTKIKRMAKYHPTVKLVIIDSKRYKALEKTVMGIVPNWSKKKLARKKRSQ
jgi:hypothetical protein